MMDAAQQQKGFTTNHELFRILQTVMPKSRNFPVNCMDEVYPRLYVGNLSAAKNGEYLSEVGITHVLNTAQGDGFGMAGTNPKIYQDRNIKFLGLSLLDVPSENITKYFEAGADFIEGALTSGGKVLVHCFMGISRSATISCAFLMLKRNMSAKEALTQIRQHRSVWPNDGFLTQLAELNNKLAKL